jgi:hypothetical protein
MTLSPVMYVEDDRNDVLLMRRAWAKVGVANPLQVVIDGEEALRYLSGEGQYANRAGHPMPCLVLLGSRTWLGSLRAQRQAHFGWFDRDSG